MDIVGFTRLDNYLCGMISSKVELEWPQCLLELWLLMSDGSTNWSKQLYQWDIVHIKSEIGRIDTKILRRGNLIGRSCVLVGQSVINFLIFQKERFLD